MNEELKDAFAALSEGAVPRDDCPPPERLWDTLQGELSDDERRDVVDHLASCPTCAEAWRLARELVPDASQPLARRGYTRFWQHPVLAAAAAGGLLLVGIGIYRASISGSEPEPGFRTGAQDEIRSLLPEAEPLSRDNCVLRWTSGPDGTRYDLQVTTEDLKTVITARSLEAPEFRIPEENLMDVEAGGKLLWQVRAILPDGERLDSRTFVSVLQ